MAAKKTAASGTSQYAAIRTAQSRVTSQITVPQSKVVTRTATGVVRKAVKKDTTPPPKPAQTPSD